MYSSGLYARAARASPAAIPAGAASAGCGSRRRPSAWRSCSARPAPPTTYGLELELLSPAETRDRLPLLDVDDVLGAAWLPGDGYLDPALLALALAEGARGHGVAVLHAHARHRASRWTAAASPAVETDRGTIRAEVVVERGGRGRAASIGRTRRRRRARRPDAPPVRRHRAVRPAGREDDPDRPRPRPHHLLPPRGAAACWSAATSRDPVPVGRRRTPLREPRTLFEPDLERFAESWDGARRRVPALRDAELAKVVNGPEAFTPDGEFILGETEVAGLWVAAGFCVHGLAGAGGVGKVMAEWIVDGLPGVRRRPHGRAPLRRPPPQRAGTPRVRALDAYSRYYDVVYPDEEREAGRPLRRSAGLRPAARARRGASARRPAGSGRTGSRPTRRRATRRCARAAGRAAYWSPAIGAECLATARRRRRCSTSPRSPSSTCAGRGAAAALGRLCANDVDREPARAVYTQLLNARGGIEADLTVTRVAEDRFRVVTGTAFGGRDLAWIRRHLPDDGPPSWRTSPARAPASACGGRARGRSSQPLTDDRPLPRGVPVPARARAHRRRRARASPSGSRSSASSAGSSTARPSTAQALWDAAVGARARARRCAPAATARSTRCGWRRATASGAPTSRRRRRRTRPASASRCGWTSRAASSAATRSRRPASAAARPLRLRCLVLDDPRAVCLGNEPVRVGRRVRRPRDLRRLRPPRRAQHRLRATCPPRSSRATRVEVGVFGRVDRRRRSCAEPLYDPDNERVRA